MDLSNEPSPYYALRDQDRVEWHLWKRSTVELARSQGKDLRIVIGSYYSQDAHFLEKSRYRDRRFARSLNKTYINVIVDRDELPAFEHLYRSIVIWMLGEDQQSHLLLDYADLPMVLVLDSQTLHPKALRDEKQLLDLDLSFDIKPKPKLIKDEPYEANPTANASQSPQPRKSSVEITFSAYLDSLFEHRIEVTFNRLELLREQMELLRSEDDPSMSHLVVNVVKHGKIADYLIQGARVRSGGELDDMDFGFIMLASLASSAHFDQIKGGFFQSKLEGSDSVPIAEKRLTVSAYLLEVYCRALALIDDRAFHFVVSMTASFLLSQLTREYTFPTTVSDLSRPDASHYAWDKKAVQRLLTEDEFSLIELFLGFDLEPNYKEGHHLERFDPLPSEIKALNFNSDELPELMKSGYEKMVLVRNDAKLVADDRLDPLTCASVSKALVLAGTTLDMPIYVEVAEQVMHRIVKKFNPVSKEGQFAKSGSDGVRLKSVDALFIIDALLALLEYKWDGRWYAMIELLWLLLRAFGLDGTHQTYCKPRFFGFDRPSDYIAVPDFAPIFDYQSDRLGETTVFMNVAQKLANLRDKESVNLVNYGHIDALERSIDRNEGDHIEYLQQISLRGITHASIILRGPLDKCQFWKSKLRIPVHMDCPIYVIPYDLALESDFFPKYLRSTNTKHSSKRVTAFFVCDQKDKLLQFNNLVKLNTYLKKEDRD